MNDLLFCRLFITGFVAHLFADFFLQNLWMNDTKTRIDLSFGGWAHGLVHFICVLPFLGWHGAVIVACLHIIIDTRYPLAWWRKAYRQSQSATGEGFVAFRMWQDQAAHIIVLALVALLLAWSSGL